MQNCYEIIYATKFSTSPPKYLELERFSFKEEEYPYQEYLTLTHRSDLGINPSWKSNQLKILRNKVTSINHLLKHL